MVSSVLPKYSLATITATTWILAVAGVADAALLSTEPQKGSFGPDFLNIEAISVSVDKFDSSLGELQSVEVWISGAIFQGLLNVVNTGTSSGTLVSASLNGAYTLTTESGSSLANVFPVATVSPLPVTIGAGQRRIFTGNLFGLNGTTSTFDTSSGVLNEFQGPGDIDLIFSGSFTTSINGQGNLVSSAIARGVADYSVVYYYEAVPEPTTLLGVMAAGGLGLLARKKLRQQTLND